MNDSPAPSTIARLRGKGGRYHHGNLRGALIVAAAGLLETAGEAGVTLRALADRAGVSRAAPYRHFADKEALLATLAGEGFRVLDRELERAAGGAPDAAARLLAMAQAYVGFARRHRRMFRLMFAGPAAGENARLLHRRLDQAVAAWPAAKPGAVGLAAWSLVHGLATLAPDADGADPEALVEAAVGVLLDGLR